MGRENKEGVGGTEVREEDEMTGMKRQKRRKREGRD